jgi:hypothetical protein
VASLVTLVVAGRGAARCRAVRRDRTEERRGGRPGNRQAGPLRSGPGGSLDHLAEDDHGARRAFGPIRKTGASLGPDRSARTRVKAPA